VWHEAVLRVSAAPIEPGRGSGVPFPGVLLEATCVPIHVENVEIEDVEIKNVETGRLSSAHPTRSPIPLAAMVAVAVAIASSAVGQGIRPSRDGDRTPSPPAPAVERAPATPVPVEFASGHLHLRLAPGVVAQQGAEGAWRLRRNGRGDARLDARLQEAVIEAIVPALRRVPADAALAAAVGLDRFVRVEVPQGTDLARLAADLQTFPGWIEIAERDGVGGVASGFPPNDPLFPVQWYLQNTGQVVNGVAGAAGADIGIASAWSVASGGADLVVAVLDSGINPHPELEGRILPGWNVPQNSTATLDGCNSHGTHVAGVIGARGDNGVGIAGVDWTVQLLPVVVVNPCSGLESFVADGLVFATDHGADIANMSLQYSAGTAFLHAAVQYAAHSGVVLVAASGNSAAAQLAFPARWPETIAVGATTPLDARWSSSNYGPGLTLVAPGVGIRSLSGFSGYSDRTGTSFAAPQVSGTIALMRSVNPCLDAAVLQSILEATATDLAPAGYDLFTGFGRLDAGAALAAVPRPIDLTGDCVVDGADLAILLGAWGPCADPLDCPADLTGDGVVDGADLALLLGAWGR
jgi:subtilisin family serine protease